MAIRKNGRMAAVLFSFIRGSKLRNAVLDFVKICAQSLPIREPVYEFGSWQAPGQEWGDLRPLFPGKRYVGADMRGGKGVDVILNLHEIDLPSASIGTVLCLETLEHVELPRRAIGEVFRILKPGGVFILSSVMAFHIHEYPADYWRFTPEGFRSLLRPFDDHVVESAGPADFPHTVVGVAYRGGNNSPSDEEWGELKGRLQEWRVSQS